MDYEFMINVIGQSVCVYAGPDYMQIPDVTARKVVGPWVGG